MNQDNIRFLREDYLSTYCKSVVFAAQKCVFCVAKVWFLPCKRTVFAKSKYGYLFLREVSLQSQRCFQCKFNIRKVIGMAFLL